MIARTNIERNLRALNRQYKNAASPREALFCSKLAILELCGWIEESMDDMVLRCAKRSLKDAANIAYIEKIIVKKNFGFDYGDNFRRMLIGLIGVLNVERLERAVDQLKKDQLKAALGSLKTIRNTEAHTHIHGVTKTINAPSWTISQFTPVYHGLLEFDSWLRHTKL